MSFAAPAFALGQLSSTRARALALARALAWRSAQLNSAAFGQI